MLSSQTQDYSFNWCEKSKKMHIKIKNGAKKEEI